MVIWCHNYQITPQLLTYLVYLACHVHLTAFGDVFHSYNYQQSWPTIMLLLTEARRPDKQISTSPGGFRTVGREQQFLLHVYVYIYSILLDNFISISKQLHIMKLRNIKRYIEIDILSPGPSFSCSVFTMCKDSNTKFIS